MNILILLPNTFLFKTAQMKTKCVEVLFHLHSLNEIFEKAVTIFETTCIL